MSSVRRRRLLRYGAVLVAGAGAGCGAQIDGTASPPTRTDRGGTPTPAFEWYGDEVSPFATVDLGSRDAVADPERNRPHEVHLWNDLEAERQVRVRVGEGDTVRLDEDLTFPPLGVMRLRLLEPGAYGLEVFVGDGRAGALTIPRSLFDCNHSRTNIRITASGGMQRQTIATEIGCPPQVDRSLLVVGEGRCGRDDDAAVSVDEEGVRIRGTIEAPVPCYGVEIGSIGFDAATGTLRVDVVTTEPPPAVTCVRCLAVIDYRAEVVLDRGTPERVVVTHDGEEVTGGDG